MVGAHRRQRLVGGTFLMLRIDWALESQKVRARAMKRKKGAPAAEGKADDE